MCTIRVLFVVQYVEKRSVIDHLFMVVIWPKRGAFLERNIPGSMLLNINGRIGVYKGNILFLGLVRIVLAM